MNLDPRDVAHGQIAFTGQYEAEQTAFVRRLARETGGLMVDAGANFGYYSLLWCGLGGGNRSLAFEASPAVSARLKENIRLNAMDGRIAVHDMALSDGDGEAEFDPGPEDETGWGGIIRQPDAGGKAFVVPTRRLDSLLQGETITLLKVDCEGADLLVLQGAAALLKARRIKHVCFEENPVRMMKLGIQPGSTAVFLKSLGYRVEPLGRAESALEFHAWPG